MIYWCVVSLTIIFCCHANFVQKTQYRVGGVFSDTVHHAAFRAVVNDLNNNNWEEPFQLIADSSNVSYYNCFETRRAVCNLLDKGIIGIFGPSSSYTSNYIQSICDNKVIPQIETHNDPKLERNQCAVNLHPMSSKVIEFFAHLVLTYKWNTLIILFDDNESLLRIAPLLELNTEYGIHLIFRQLDKDQLGSYREVLLRFLLHSIWNIFVLRGIKKMPQRNILLECSVGILEEVLIQSQQVGILTESFNFIITNLDFGTIDLEQFQHGGANITGIRLFDPENEKVLEMKSQILNILKLSDEEAAKWKMRISTALLIDGVNMFHGVIKHLVSRRNTIEVQSLGCQDMFSWKYGYTIANQIKGKQYDGLTGNIRFDFEGFRSHFKLELIELTALGLLKVGEYDTSTRSLKIQREHIPILDENEHEYNLFNRTFRVIIVLVQTWMTIALQTIMDWWAPGFINFDASKIHSCVFFHKKSFNSDLRNDNVNTAPYAMLKETTDQLIGNDRYEGFCIDLIEKLGSLLGFNYTFLVQEDGKNGNLNRSTWKWDGAIRQIIDGNADLAITDLTITSERESAVDFTMPFMNLGISILYKKPEPVPPSLFMFTSPFSTEVWLMLGVAYILVSAAIFVMSRLSPSEWTNPFPCVEEPEYLVNQFSIRNSLWFTIGGLLQQGSELAPISICIRTASGFWWFFVLIMVSSYTANLAAFLTVETLVTPFKNIDDLSRQTEIKFGAKRQGATENFFRDSNVSSYRRVYEHFKSHPDEMPAENDEGVERVDDENYAFLMESTSIEYVVQRHCSLAQVGGLLDDKGYGIAMKQDSPYRNDLSTAIIKLQETGVLTQLKIKWWKEKRGGSTCSVKNEESEAEALDLKNVGGVFLVLFVGAVLAFFGSFLELIGSIWMRCKMKNESFTHQLEKEMKFFIKFKKNVKELAASEDNVSKNNVNQY